MIISSIRCLVLSTERLSRCLRECASGRISPQGEGPQEAPVWKVSQVHFLGPTPGVCGVGQLSVISQGLFCLGTEGGASDLSAPLILVSVEMGTKRKPRVSLSQLAQPCPPQLGEQGLEMGGTGLG